MFGYKLDYEFKQLRGAPCVPALRDQYDEWGMLPHYSTDIAAAWEVAEKLRLHVGPSALHHNWWCATIDGLDHEHHASAPMAICLAALAAVKQDK